MMKRRDKRARREPGEEKKNMQGKSLNEKKKTHILKHKKKTFQTEGRSFTIVIFSRLKKKKNWCEENLFITLSQKTKQKLR
jgi:hypothetical protein